ncbi:helix-turn-helix Psq domain [Phytophthora infestans]|nr:helix-turn-helix Psq domain [Phytophthora infestans]KAF4150263.1 helix-turn-helix Psq domain [Phytophthora infestans]
MSRGCAAADVSVRRYLSEADEKEVLRTLKEKQRHQTRITSDDVRQAVRAVASKGGKVLLPTDFPPSGWVLEFKRAHGFVHINSFAFSAAVNSSGKAAAAFRLPDRLEVPLRFTAPDHISSANTSSTYAAANGNSHRNSSTSVAQTSGRSLSSGNASDVEKETSTDRRIFSSSDAAHVVMYSMSPSGPRTPFDSEIQRQTQLRHSFSQRHQRHLQQQQRRGILVNDHRREAARSEPARDLSVDHEEMRSSSQHEDGTSTGSSTCARGGGNGVGDVSSFHRERIRLMHPHNRQAGSDNGSSMDEMQDAAPVASSASDKRGYKLSHTVPTETWEKAIAAVEQQGMSLRAAAKLYGVHFAALHRRVKKRAQSEKTKGTTGYFHPSDEAGIMRVVVARAELGVLMTFDELMRLVEAAALRKLPDISMDSARKLLTRFQSRNEMSIRHIIEDWPPPRPAIDAAIGDQHQPYLGHPGFDFRTKPTGTRGTSTAAAVVTATSKTLFVPPIRLVPSTVNYGYEPTSPGVRLTDTMRAMELETTKMM